MSNVVSFTAPLLAAGTATSGPLQTTRALNITGTVFADAAGTVYVDQGGDGNNWDYTTSVAVAANTGTSINVTLIDSWYQVRYINGPAAQTVFRCFVNPRDPYGAFLQNALPPSSGGAFAVFLYQPGSGAYSWVGRFDGLDAWNAITNAALSIGQNGKYAASPVTQFVVSTEAIDRSTTHSPDSF